MTSVPAKILVFDSGLGGISIFEGLQQQHPACALIYCSDNAAFPYGIKSETELIERVGTVLTRLNQEYAPDIFVIACNTASTVALLPVRSRIKAPIVGVVPAIKPAALLAQTPNIGLLATPATVQRAYTQSLIDEFGSQFQWIKIGSSDLVQLAEDKMYGKTIPYSNIKNIVAPFAQFSAEEMDTIVLACTHFPLVKTELQSVLPRIKNWVESTEAIASRVGYWLQELGFAHEVPQEAFAAHEIVLTKALGENENLTPLLQKLHFTKKSILEI